MRSAEGTRSKVDSAWSTASAEVGKHCQKDATKRWPRIQSGVTYRDRNHLDVATDLRQLCADSAEPSRSRLTVIFSETEADYRELWTISKGDHENPLTSISFIGEYMTHMLLFRDRREFHSVTLFRWLR